MVKRIRRPVLEVKHLAKTFRTWRSKVEAVKDVSFSLYPGQIVGLLGPNGAGKTTTLSLLLGILRSEGGGGTMFGCPLGSARARSSLGFLAEHVALPPFYSPRKLLKMLLSLSALNGEGDERVTEMLRQCGLAEHADRRIGHLSAGLRQRVGWAQALIHQPRLLLLDEPTSNLDPEGRIEVKKWLRQACKAGAAVLLSTHIVTDVEALAGRVLFMKEGGIIKDLRGAKSLEKTYLRIMSGKDK